MGPYILENDLLQVEIVPELGGRITSFRSVRTGEEFLLPSLRETVGDPATIAFSEGHVGGFDECLPSVSACDSIGEEAAISDHGDLWRKRWSVQPEENGLSLQVDADSRPLRLTRRATLAADTLTLEYELRNLSDSPLTWLWCAHPLFQAEYGDRILLPRKTAEVTIEYATDEQLLRRNPVAWPVCKDSSGDDVDLSVLRESAGGTAYKLFARNSASGGAILYRNRIAQGIAVHFDETALPYLGVWVNAEGWPREEPDRRLTVALEPATCDYDSLFEANEHRATNRLGGHALQHWTIAIQLLGARRSCGLADLNL